MTALERYVIARDDNVLKVDFSREPDPPAPKFPGAGAMRALSLDRVLRAFTTSKMMAEVA